MDNKELEALKKLKIKLEKELREVTKKIRIIVLKR